LTESGLENVVIGVPTNQFIGASITVNKVTNVPLALGGVSPTIAFAMKISELSRCTTGITLAIPIPSSVTNPHVVVFIDGEWIKVTTTVSNNTAFGTISCDQLSSARRSDKRAFGTRVESGDVIVGLADQSQLVTPSLGRLAAAVLILMLTAFLFPGRKKSDRFAPGPSRRV
jgi:hypothetical protein